MVLFVIKCPIDPFYIIDDYFHAKHKLNGCNSFCFWIRILLIRPIPEATPACSDCSGYTTILKCYKNVFKQLLCYQGRRRILTQFRKLLFVSPWDKVLGIVTIHMHEKGHVWSMAKSVLVQLSLHRI